ncbi:nuclear transport factor 2 family protein [Spirillospora sp. CA-142024]|uniref:nuclear transport factor 2 family protein n=1 Tax=Spirillospora sp. CA-142024 TaxID=3240036 RepID=UPI003D8C9A78
MNEVGSGSAPSPAGPGLLERLARIESHQAIGQLPIRYAIAVDSRDLDAWVACFRPDVDMGRRGTGRAALRAYIEPLVRGFYRSVHQICGHRIEFTDRDHATGAVYCRAEHEVGDRWIVMAICYLDDYVRIDGEWYFSRRREKHWYAADVTERPQAVGFTGWDGAAEPPLPAGFPSWALFWDGDPAVEGLTGRP